jgi:hypothetical protein
MIVMAGEITHSLRVAVRRDSTPGRKERQLMSMVRCTADNSSNTCTNLAQKSTPVVSGKRNSVVE